MHWCQQNPTPFVTQCIPDNNLTGYNLGRLNTAYFLRQV